MDVRAELKQGIIDGHVIPHFQPIVDLRSGDVTGFELLARWHHPVHGVVAPGDFIPVAEAEGLIPLLTEFLLRRALQSWRDLPKNATLSINISPTQLIGEELSTMIETVGGEAGFPLTRLILEITESSLLEANDDVQKVIARVKHMGCKLALDDFGTGFSSLTYLRKLPFDILKIDQSFVRTMVTCREDRKIVGAVIGLGKSLGLRIVAEGIEERAQADMLVCLGCECGQGWYYGRPAPHAISVRRRFAGSTELLAAVASRPRSNNYVCMEALPAQSYAQLTAIYNAAPVGLGYFDCNFRLVNLNHRLASFHCLTIDEIVGRTLQEISPERFALAEPYLVRARAGEVIEHVEFDLSDVLNRPATHLASFQPALDEVGEVVGVLLAVTDISDRKNVEVALKDSYEHYANMVELSPQIPWTMNADGSDLQLSRKWEELTGFPIAERWFSSVHAEDRAGVSTTIREAIRKKQAFDLKFRVEGPAKGNHWVRSRGTPFKNSNGVVLRWYGSVELVDEQRRMLEDLRESHAHLQRVLDALPVGVVIAEAPTGRIVSRNPRALQILAQDPKSFDQISDYSKRVAYYRDGKRLDAEDFPLAKALRKGQVTDSERVFYDMGNEKGKWIDLSGAPLRNSDGEIVGAVAAMQELTDIERDSKPHVVIRFALKSFRRLEEIWKNIPASSEGWQAQPLS